MKLPAFLIIGAQRCGTTSLYNYLIKHPCVTPATKKEVHFFDVNYHRGLDWYLAEFPERGAGFITGEASPYYFFHPHVPGRVRQAFPDIKLVLLLRNPIDRAYSHYHHEVRQGAERLSFEEAIAAESTRLDGELKKILEDQSYYSFNHQHFSYLSRGIYVDQLETWADFFPSNQILIIRSEDLYNDSPSVLARVTRFLDLPAHPQDRLERHNELSYEPMNPETRIVLDKRFSSHNKRLFEFTGFDFQWESR